MTKKLNKFTIIIPVILLTVLLNNIAFATTTDINGPTINITSKQTDQFNDVDKQVPQYEAIYALVDENIINGYDDNSFKPNKLITRAELLKIVLKHVGFTPDNQSNVVTPYSDVPSNSWFAPYVQKAIDLNLFSPAETNYKFYPDQTISKVEALKIILPLEGIPTPYTNSTNDLVFTDVNKNSKYLNIARAVQDAGLYLATDTKFNGFKNLTRAEAAELIYLTEEYHNQNSGSSLSESEKSLLSNTKFSILLNAWGKINDEYIEQQNVDQDSLVYGAIEGMLSSLKDPYSVFQKPEEAQQLEDQLNGNFTGIGTVISQLKDEFIITQVLKDSPADKAGVLSGDTIIKVDDTSVTGKTSEDVVKMIKGEKGTTVKLTIKRNNTEMTFTITRDLVNINSVELIKPQIQIPSNIGYIAISQFSNNTGSDFAASLKDVLSKNPKGIILDLRNNPGGYLDESYNVMGHFIKKGQAMINIRTLQGTEPENSIGDGEVGNIPVIVLINKNTASAAEVVAGALQDYKIAKLIGETSYGKGTVQEISNYTDGSLLKLSIAHWMTPLKNDINKKGLTPDIKVDETKDDVLGNTDSQLQRAIDELNK